tara:strand:- start:433 stop:1032 length:600 start_codon:yes stop_codon:yes gene_type:complete
LANVKIIRILPYIKKLKKQLMTKLIAKLDLVDYCDNKSTLKVYLREGGELKYTLSGTKTGIGFSLSNLQIGYKDGNRLPNHVKDIKDRFKKHTVNLRKHLIECIEDSVKTYIPLSYKIYQNSEHCLMKCKLQGNKHTPYELEKPKTGVTKSIIAEILRDEFRDALILLGQEDKIKQIESRVENSYKEITEEQYQEKFTK